MTSRRRTATPIGAYKSKLELRVAEHIASLGVPVVYEKSKFKFHIDHSYTPDFMLPNGIFIEVKGYFPAEDRRIVLNVIKCNPSLDLRMLFSNSGAYISKGSLTTYAGWCLTHGIKFADGTIPQAWLEETKV